MISILCPYILYIPKEFCCKAEISIQLAEISRDHSPWVADGFRLRNIETQQTVRRLTCNAMEASSRWAEILRDDFLSGVEGFRLNTSWFVQPLARNPKKTILTIIFLMIHSNTTKITSVFCIGAATCAYAFISRMWSLYFSSYFYFLLNLR